MKKRTGRGADGVTYLGLRNGRKWWLARLYWTDERTGKQCERERTFQADSKHQAMQRRAELLEEAKAGTVSKADRKRFADVSAAWLATVTTRSSLESWGSHARKLDKHFGSWWLDKVTARAMQDYLDALDLEPGTVNSIRDVLKHVFDHAISQTLGRRRHWADANPVRDVKRRSTRAQGLTELGEAPRRALTEDEAAAHLRDLRQHEPEVYPLVLVQYVLGCRFAEVSALRHEDVDLESGIVKIRRGQYKGATGPTKGKYAREAALSLEVRVLIKRHVERVRSEGYAGADELVFPRPPTTRRKLSSHMSSSTLHHAIARSFTRLGFLGEGVERPVKGKTHVARHTLVTLAEGLAAETVVRKVVGHTTASMHARYQHAHTGQVIDLAEAVGSRLLKKKGGK